MHTSISPSITCPWSSCRSRSPCSHTRGDKSADLSKGALVLPIVSTPFGAGAFLTGESAGKVEQIAGGLPGH